MKLNNYIKFPIILGLVCLISGGALAGINYLTAPVIAKNNAAKASKALYAIIGEENVASTKDLTEESTDLSPNIKQVVEVTLKDGSKAYYYQLESSRGYSGTVTFGVAFNSEGCMGYFYISGTEDTLGINVARENAVWSSALANYELGSGNFIWTGGSAQQTVPVIRAAVDVAYADYMARQGIVIDTSPIKITGVRTGSAKARTRYIMSANNTNGYGSISLEVVLNMNTNVVREVTIRDFGAASEGYGKELLTGEDSEYLTEGAKTFYDTYVNVPNSGLSFDLFTGENAADPQDTENLTGANAIFETGSSHTARSYYALIQKAILMALEGDPGVSPISTIGKLVADKSTDISKVYSVYIDNLLSPFSKLVVNTTIDTTDAASPKVVDIEVENYVNTTYGFGYRLIVAGEGGHVAEAGSNFYNTYVNIPEGGFDASIFTDIALDNFNNSVFTTGATYTACSYYYAVQKAVLMNAEGDTGVDFDEPKNSYTVTIEDKGNGVYDARVINSDAPSSYNAVKAQVTLDVANKKVTTIAVDTANGASGTDGYGEDLFIDGSVGSGTTGTDFFNTFVNVPSGGFDFSVFTDYDPQNLKDIVDNSANIANMTGATYSANNYMVLVNAVIKYAQGGN